MALPLRFTESRNIEDYRPLIAELTDELGARFGGSMENWCGIGSRPYPLPIWQVYLVRDESGEAIGVCSYYRQVDDPAGRYWIGWIGVRKASRRQGSASTMFAHVLKQLIALGADDVWVYTGSEGAEHFYRAMGMHDVGQFHETGLEQAAAAGDESVLRMPVASR